MNILGTHSKLEGMISLDHCNVCEDLGLGWVVGDHNVGQETTVMICASEQAKELLTVQGLPLVVPDPNNPEEFPALLP